METYGEASFLAVREGQMLGQISLNEVWVRLASARLLHGMPAGQPPVPSMPHPWGGPRGFCPETAPISSGLQEPLGTPVYSAAKSIQNCPAVSEA